MDDHAKITRVDAFFGIDGPDYARVEACARDFTGRIDPQLVPIAHDAGGNLILLSCSGESMGQVFFVDLETLDVEHPATASSLLQLAQSFSDFLASVEES